jgi:predicted nucleic acid-binding protein
MSAKVFLDTNVLVYAYDRGNPAKQSAAQQLIEQNLLAEPPRNPASSSPMTMAEA